MSRLLSSEEPANVLPWQIDLRKAPLPPNPTTPRSSVPSQTPRTVGPFRLLQRLGEGGMGIVFAGHDDRLDRGVAIKMIRRSDAQPLARERFLLEARAAASVAIRTSVPSSRSERKPASCSS